MKATPLTLRTVEPLEQFLRPLRTFIAKDNRFRLSVALRHKRKSLKNGRH